MTITLLAESEQIRHDRRQRKAERVVDLGLGCNALLAAVKLTAGILGHSQALLADGINSISDVVYFLVVKLFVKFAGKSADEEHPYGHYQYETIAALVVGAFVITTGIAIFWDSVNAGFDLMSGMGTVSAVRTFTLWVAAGTILLKILLMLQARAIGRSTNNLAIIALARDHRNDIFAASGVGIGILLSMAGFAWADPAAGAVVAVIVANTGLGILREAAEDLMDSVPSNELSDQIKAVLAEEEHIDHVEEVHAHRFGPYLVANITIGVAGDMSVSDADEVSTQAEHKLLSRIEMLRKVYVHCHPVQAGGSPAHRRPTGHVRRPASRPPGQPRHPQAKP